MKYKFPTWTPVALLFLCATVVLFLPILFGKVLMPAGTDIAVYYYPAFHFYVEAIQTGQSFLWNPHLFSGFPMYLSQSAGFFDPLNILLATLFSDPFMLELRLMVDVLLTLTCSYVAARALALSRRASVLTALSYIIAFEWFYLSNPLTANSLFLLPLLIWCCVRMLSGERTVRYVLIGGAGLGWALLCGYTQIVFYAVALTGIYLAAFAFLSRMKIGSFVGVILRYALIVVLGALLALPQLLPTALFLPHTSRADAASYEQLTLKVIAPGDLLLAFVPPHFYVPYITPGRKALFVGALWMLLAVGALALTAAVWRRREHSSQEQHIAAIGVTFLFAFVAAVQYSPLYYVLNQLPIFSLFRFPFRFMFLGTFLLSLLAAYGFDRAEQLLHSRVFRIAAYLLAIIATLFIGGVTLIQMIGASGGARLAALLSDVFAVTVQGRLGFTKDLVSYTHAFEQGLAAYRELLSLTNPGILLPLLCLAASAVLAVLFVRGHIQIDRFQSATFILGLCTFAAVAVGGWKGFVPSELYGYPNPFQEIIASDAQRYRFYSFLIGEAATQAIPPQYKLSPEEAVATHELASAGGVSNLHFIHDLNSVDGYDQFEPRTILTAMDRIGGELGAGYGAGTSQERTSRLLANLDTLGMMSGKYIISGVPLESDELTLVATSSVTAYRMTLYLYEYPNAYPRYFLADHGCTTCVPADAVIEPVLIENGNLEFVVTASDSTTLVLSETNVPGWTATLDGNIVPARRVNELYMGVDIPKGEHRVTFEYQGMLGELSILRALGLVYH